jgi:hypothetical protein
VRRHRGERLVLGRERRVELDDARARPPGHDVDEVLRRQCLLEVRQLPGVGHDDPGVGVGDVVAVVVGLVHRADGDWDRADVQRSEEGGRVHRRVVEDEQDAILLTDADLLQQAAEAADPPAQLVVGQRPVRGDERSLVAATGLHLPLDDAARVVSLRSDHRFTTTDLESV